MDQAALKESPLVSVVIPCYNHAQYLPKAINSVLNQSYSEHEIIVIDDGSSDNTKDVCLKFPEVIYIHQKNAGLSAARNTGIKHAKGEYLVFLDADDWLVPDGIKLNLSFIVKNSKIAFVSGGHKIYYEPDDKSWLIQKKPNNNTYLELLKGNFIGMHATVMYSQWVFKKLKFDTTIKYCEDYDLYLKIAKSFPVLHHTNIIAVYRIHDNNMSSNYHKMLRYALLILSKQKKLKLSENEKSALKYGQDFWKSYYSKKTYNHLIHQLYETNNTLNIQEIKSLKRHNSKLYKAFKLEKKEYQKTLKNNYRTKKIKAPTFMQLLRTIKNKLKYKKSNSIKVNLGDFNRTTPFSTQFGYDRGGPIDRYYIESFLSENANKIKNNVLEIGDNTYSLRFGGSNIKKSDILHIDDKNEKATYIGDLSDAPHVPSNNFDCVILTQTLHLIYNYKAAIETCYRILKPGGALLLTVPGISHIAQDQWGEYWLWSFTKASITKILQEYFPEKNITTNTYGNVLVSSAFLYGLGLPELNQEQLDYNDPHFQLIISASAIK
ncbi:glycosyl transferase family 2 [Tamlana nanhaiensis]|uniref:Glycosyl transferase family 2 n=1 Tax=Neotamlana nanhaiensis TaxID=1382798 RepID=A0A0D7W751_9FLAO|nr:glycosyltransferase [Tamlana nanhaiensis]KJD34538.1 glycosyl transferase family 2 [Tamlana nanhaiensis]